MDGQRVVGLARLAFLASVSRRGDEVLPHQPRPLRALPISGFSRVGHDLRECRVCFDRRESRLSP